MMTGLKQTVSAFALLCAAFGGPAVLAQSSGQDTGQEQSSEQDTGSEAGENTPAREAQKQTDTEAKRRQSRSQSKSQANRTLYFIGPDIQAKRQTGPAVGRPTSIIPQPFAKPGSLTLPPAESAEYGQDANGNAPGTVSGDVTGLPEGSSVPNGAVPNGAAADNADGTRLNEDGTLREGLSQETAQTAPEQGSTNAADLGFEVSELERLDPSGIPVSLADGKTTETVWQGYDRAQIIRFLGEAAKPGHSLVLQRLARDIAASRFVLPTPGTNADIDDIVRGRLAVFRAQADATSYERLLNAMPKDRDWSSLAEEFTVGHLLAGRLLDACALGEQRREIDNDVFWVRLAAFCHAADGNRVGVDFELSVIEEAVRLDPTFYTLIDRILVEAEQPAGSIITDPVLLSGALPVQVLPAVMARLARSEIEDVDLTDIDPLAVPILLDDPGLGPIARAALTGYMQENVRTLGPAFARYAAALEYNGDIQRAIETPGFLRIATEPEGLAASSARTDTQDEGLELDGVDPMLVMGSPVRTNAILAALAQADDAGRMAALRVYRSEFTALGKLGQLAPVVEEITSNWSDADTTPQMRAFLARLALMNGDRGQFERWARGLRTEVAGQNADVDTALLGLAPYFAIDGSLSGDAALTRWLDDLFAAQSNAGQDNDALSSAHTTAQAELALALIDSVGGAPSAAVWGRLNDAPIVLAGHVVAPHFWRQLSQTQAAGDPLMVLLHAMRLMQQVSPADMPAASGAALVAALESAGFDVTARMLAAEIMAAQDL